MKRVIMSDRKSVYLWLECEGCQRFGPFHGLRFEHAPLRICYQDSNVIAEFNGTDWLTTDDKYRNFRWGNPMITASPHNPYTKHR